MKNKILAFLLCLSALTPAFAEKIEEKDLAAYLFVYFTGNHISQEAVCYAVSMDGYTYWALNDNKPVIDSKVISSTGGVRDPHILRCEDGKTFYMVVTDMVSDNGWDSNRAMVLLKSTDLINWSHSVINMQKRYEGQERLKRVWAPQTIFDPEAKKYMVYWSMKYGDGPDVIYYAYANEDFTDLEGEPKPLFVPADKKSCIDGDIVYKDGIYHLFYKTEGHGNGIRVATTNSLTSGQWKEDLEYKQQTKEAVEGAGTFKLIGEDKYILMYDVYMKGTYQFTETTDLEHFKVIDHDVKMNFHPRHGTIIPITRSELKRITDRWGKPAELGELPNNPVLPGFHADPEIVYSNLTGKYYIYSTTDGQPGWGRMVLYRLLVQRPEGLDLRRHRARLEIRPGDLGRRQRLGTRHRREENQGRIPLLPVLQRQPEERRRQADWRRYGRLAYRSLHRPGTPDDYRIAHRRRPAD